MCYICTLDDNHRRGTTEIVQAIKSVEENVGDNKEMKIRDQTPARLIYVHKWVIFLLHNTMLKVLGDSSYKIVVVMNNKLAVVLWMTT